MSQGDLILMGPPGSGKGTQARRMVDELGYVQLATGDLFRAHLSQGTELGRLAQTYMSKGQYVPDDVTVKMVRERLADIARRTRIVFDGFPRTVAQAEALRKSGVDIDFVVEIEVGDTEILRRMSGRRVHPASGRTYHIDFNPPKVPGKDDLTGEPLVQRPDDNEETVMRRIASYHEVTKPLVNYYLKWAESGDPRAPHYVNIYGRGSIEHIRDKMFAALAQQHSGG